VSASATLVRARRVLTGHDGELIEDGGVLVADGRVVAVGRAVELADAAAAVVDAGDVLMPGMVDAHSHLRGIPLSAHDIPARPLESWLCSLAAMTPLDTADDVLVACADLLETGVTAVQAIVHSFDEPAALAQLWARTQTAVERAGIRAVLCAGFADRAEYAPEPATGVWAGVPVVSHGTDAAGFATLVADVLGDGDDPAELVRWGLGPVAPQWVGDDALAVMAVTAPDRRRHTHLDESRLQRDWVRGQAAPVARLEAAGCLDARLSAAHAVDLFDEEMTAIAAAAATLVHCPLSNRALRVGTARVAQWHRSGIEPALGLDSAGESADMFEVMRAAVADAAALGDPVTPAQAFAMATTGGARALGAPGVGRILVEGPADLVGLDLPGAGDAHDVRTLVELIVQTGSSRAVGSVWVQGRRVVEGGRAVVGTADARERLREALAADADRRASRRRDLLPLLDRIDAEIAGAAA